MEADEYRRMAAAESGHWWYRSTRALLQQVLGDVGLHDGGTGIFLDAGGGTGAAGGWLADEVPTVLAEYERIALGYAAAHHSTYLLAQADLRRLPFGSAAFSGVLCVTALCHRMNPDPAEVVSELARVTRPGGWVLLLEPGEPRARRGHDDVTHTARRFSVTELAALCTAAGLDIGTATGAYWFLLPLARVLARFESGPPKSDLGRHRSGLFGIFGGLATLERLWLRRWRLPNGLSAVVVARKPVDQITGE